MNPLDHPEWRSFVEAVRDAPADLTTRLVAADWLQDTGRPELEAWAQFVRHQCAATAHRASLSAAGGGPVDHSHPTKDWCDCVGCRSDRAAVEIWERWATTWVGVIAPDSLITASADAMLWRDGFPVALRVRPDGLRAVSLYHLTGEDIRITASLVESIAQLLADRMPLDGLVFDVFAEQHWVAAFYRPDENPLFGSYHFGHSHGDGRTPAVITPAPTTYVPPRCQPSTLAGAAKLVTEILHERVTRQRPLPGRPLRRNYSLPTPARILEWLAPTRDPKATVDLRRVMR